MFLLLNCVVLIGLIVLQLCLLLRCDIVVVVLVAFILLNYINFVAILECPRWCAQNEKPWDIKCSWSKYCNACPECGKSNAITGTPIMSSVSILTMISDAIQIPSS